MSAITGIIHLNKQPIRIENGTRLMESLKRYPADDIQTWNNNTVFLGCHMQWITPESIGESLPFYDYERKLAIVSDAIIDNREELFGLLKIDPILEKSIPDSQLILRGYEKWGEESPKYLVGDFAYVIWDERAHSIFAARDFSGGRTLYYRHNHQNFSFCTTIEPLLTQPDVTRQLNEKWLAEYLAITTVIDTIDSSMTPYQDIKQIPPAHFISITRDSVKIKRYCNLYASKPLKLNSNEEYVEAFQEVFSKAVKSRLRTIHKVGAQLSGGLDSGAVVSFAAKQLQLLGKELQTFSYIPTTDFIDYTPKYLMPNERPFIESTVNYVGNVKAHYLDFEGKSPYTELDDFLETMEMPYKFFENSFWIKGMFENAQKENVGVLLNGGRGNLGVSWGSAIEYYAILLKKMKWFRLIKELNYYSQNIGGARLRRLPIIVREAFPMIDRLFPLTTQYKSPKIINQEFANRTRVFDKLRKFGMDETGWYSTDNIFKQRKNHFEDVFHWNATNTVSTKFSLRYSLWKRDPTNDIRVIRFCLSLPEDQYVQNGMDRALIRRATQSYLPDKIRLNQHIRGVQGADWVHRMKPNWGLYIKDIQQLKKDNLIFEFIDAKVLNVAISKAENGPRVENATDPDYRILMRSLIVYKFINKMFT